METIRIVIEPTMVKFVDHLNHFYVIHKTLSLYLKYGGGIRLKIEMKDEELNKTITPTLVNLNQRRGGNRVIVTPPDNPNNVRIGVVNQSGRVTAAAPRKVMSFEKVITKSQSRAGQALPIPRKFVQDFIRKKWKKLILQVGGSRFYSCNLLLRPGSDKDCHLGKPRYKFVSDMNLRTGDKVVFRTIIKGLNKVNVDIIRKGN
ncbi:DNA-binding barrel domain superfamily [Sesbania bispinosa]|nr:DNA-binding barrel domain superfamily [Sesbania bispinosa]